MQVFVQRFVVIFCFAVGDLFAAVVFVPFKPNIYPSDSRVFSLEDVGELPLTSSPPYSSSELENVLVCKTDKSRCCLSSRLGIWKHNNINIPSRYRMEDYFRTRDNDHQIHLNLRAMHSDNPATGEFCCELPDASGATQTHCVDIVSTSLSVTISSSGANLAGQPYFLTCSASVSGGGSASRIVWLRGATTEMEMNNVTTLTLTFQSLKATDGGTYTCRVEVDTLVKISSIELEVVTSNPITSVTITPPSPTGIAGADSLTLTCTANIIAGTPSFSWTGPESRGPTPVTAVHGSTTFTDSFVLGRVKESYREIFTCQVSVATFTVEAAVTVDVQVPSIRVFVTGSGAAIALRSYTLTCTVTAPSTLNLTSHSYQWLRDDETLSEETNQTLVFVPHPIEDSREYTCQYAATSPYLNNNVDVTSAALEITITLVAPAPLILKGSSGTESIFLTWSKSSQDVVDTYIIVYVSIMGCHTPSHRVTVYAPARSYNLTSLEESIEYRITITAMNTAGSSSTIYVGTTLATVPSCCVPSPISQSVSLTSITIRWEREACLLRNGQSRHYSIRYRETGSSTIIATATISVVARTYTASPLYPRTSYTFEVALVNEVGTGPYTATDISTSTPTNVGLLLGGVPYRNNSVVTLTDIGVDTAALFCLTDRVTCCGRSDSDVGALDNWKFPGGSPVVNMSVPVADMFYRSRGASAVLLHRRGAASGPTGVFTCAISDSQGHLQQVFVGIYPPEAGSPLITSLTYNITSGVLTCESTGGPASSVTWSRSGHSYQQSQRVVDTSTATYHNLLSIISSQLSHYSGSFSCSVSNSRGKIRSTTMAYQSIGLSGHRSLYPLGSSASVTCFSNLTVQEMQWLNASSNEVLLSISRQQELVLNIEKITSDMQYTCEVTIVLPTGNTVVDRQSFMLHSYKPMVRPLNSIMISDTTSSGVTVHWMFVGPFNSIQKETCVLMYGTTSRPLDSRSSEVTADGGSQTYSIPLHSLAPATDYNYVIRCRNEFDSAGITSAEMLFRTNDSESGPVKGVTATSLGDSILAILWIPPAMPNGVITSFLVRINDLAKGTVTDYITSDGEVTSYTASDLVAGVPYNVSVAAVNMAGPGRLSFIIHFTRELEPSISPKDVLVTRMSISMMTVSWTGLTLSEARGFITHYTVAYFPSSGGSKRQEPNTLYKTVNNDSSETSIEGLDKNTAYSVQVSASTAAGAGGYSTLTVIPSPVDGREDIGTIVGAVAVTMVAVVVIIVIVILVIVFVVKTRKTRSVSIRTDAPTCNTNEYEELEIKKGPSHYEVPVLNGVEEIELKEGPSEYEVPVLIGVKQETELKEGPSEYEVPFLNGVEKIELNEGPSEYEVPVPNGVKEETKLKEGPSEYEVPVLNGADEIDLKEGPSNYEIPVSNTSALSNQPGRFNMKPYTAHGKNTTSPNFGFRGRQEFVEGTPSDGLYETILYETIH